MPRAIPEPVRREIVRRHLAGEPLAEVAAALQLPWYTVRRLWRRYRQHGEAGFAADYARCSHPGPRGDPEIQKQALALKRAHPRYGAGIIRLLLAEWFSEPELPQVRTLQTWFRNAGLTARRVRKVSAPRDRGQRAHAVWQLDAKERLLLADGSEACTFSLVDEATGAALGAVTFPPGTRGGRARRGDPGVAAGQLRPVGAARTAPGG